MPAAVITSCSFEGCPNEAHHGGLCHGHEKQRAKDKQLRELGERIDGKGPKARWARLEAAAIRFADATEAPAGADAKRAYARAKGAFRAAVYRYFVDKYGDIHFTQRDGSPL
jgi:hypothetical protein